MNLNNDDDLKNIPHLKGGIHSFVWSTKSFLYKIRELRYKQNNIGYQILKIWRKKIINLIIIIMFIC